MRIKASLYKFDEPCKFLKPCKFKKTVLVTIQIQEPWLHVQGERQMHSGRDEEEPVPVLQVQEVPGCEHEEGRWVNKTENVSWKADKIVIQSIH